jgi:(p)ppGpp synthase/HD superfamily hydrolase
MKFTPRLNKAIEQVAILHAHHYRNDAMKTPYVTHLVAVMILVSQITDDEDVLIAALFHDSLEDIPGYNMARLIDDIGERSALLVSTVTEPLDPNKEFIDQLPWLTRKERYLSQLRSGHDDAILIALADKIHNTESLIEGIHKEGEMFLSRFHSSLDNRIWLHEEVVSIAKEKNSNAALVDHLESTITRLKALR